MPHEVKMPQLGMTQDSGVIVAWLKAAGDAVSEGDALFEVETDKATMEVEAQTGGFLAGIRASEGEDVPVGDVIALIVDNEGEVTDHAAAPNTETAAPEQEPAAAEPGPEASDEQTPPAPEPAPPPKPGPNAAPTPATGKVLASPKAKRLALERGIDLAMLSAQGVSEPIHAADLSRAATGGHSILTASATGAAMDALLASSDAADRTALFAAFARGAWRMIFDSEAGVAIRALDGTVTVTGADSAALTLVDLCGTRLTSYAPSAGGPTLTAARQGDGYALTLAFPEGALPMPQAAALLDDIAARVEDPIRQLL